MIAVGNAQSNQSRQKTMIALLVKPKLMATRKLNNLMMQLSDLDPITLGGTDSTSIKLEIAELWRTDPNLLVVACGGDGTFHLALNSLPDLQIPLALVPMGTGNDLARYLGIKSPTVGVAALRSANPVNMDMGTIELSDGTIRRFAGIVSCGFDAQVNERANSYRGPTGTLKYLAALFVELIHLSSWELNISGRNVPSRSGRFTLVAVGNTTSYGGGLRMCPSADAFDHQFEVTYVANVSRRLLIRVLPKVFWGGHVKHQEVTQSSLDQIQITGESFPVYADGEKVGLGPVHISLHPGAMRVCQA
jgi:diacylglycerol kinase (ATP)